MVQGLNDRRIRYHWQENSGGPAAPRNWGTDHATGEWICLLDADDLWYEDKLDHVARAVAMNPGVVAICHDEYRVDMARGTRSRTRYGPYTPDFYRTLLLQGNRCSTSAMSVNRAFLNANGLRFNTAADHVIVEDYDLWLEMARAGGRFTFIDIVLGEYLIEGDNISSDGDALARNQEAVLRRHVFAVQEFQGDTDLLWRQVSVRLKVDGLSRLLGRGRVASALRDSSELVLSPVVTSRYLALKLCRALLRAR